MEPKTLSGNTIGAPVPERTYRVVQWATGNIGTRALRGVIEHPHLALAGLYVHTPDKAGRDAGDLCGAESTGVAATTDIDDILALGADCVLYMPRSFDLAEVCRILASGSNIVTTRGEFHHASAMDPAARSEVEAACALGGTSIHSTGSSPGFVTEALPLVLTSIQRNLDRLAIDEFADLSQRNTPGILFDIMGFGREPAVFEDYRIDHIRSNFGPSLQSVADALGLRLDSVEARGELATAREQVSIAAGTIDPGTVAAQRVTVTGVRDGAALLQFRATWYCTTDVVVDWDIRPTGWHIDVAGDAPMDVDIRFPIPLERMSAVSPSYTANRAVNAVPVVCAAAPGIRTTAELPQMLAALG
ncbi:NAD(P)H-dependent amine dehydrogenase family protein [Rhodococcus zopfii]|uniref:NAD(P)H-dependent amine dehydrogenase family protein n=1 Tax=Rhodococcus zopfii TaxID=43772 RepID=UPI001F0FE274|nr:dihydrodipicolinate reductase [Rhodococcus zopfii]